MSENIISYLESESIENAKSKFQDALEDFLILSPLEVRCWYEYNLNYFKSSKLILFLYLIIKYDDLHKTDFLNNYLVSLLYISIEKAKNGCKDSYNFLIFSSSLTFISNVNRGVEAGLDFLSIINHKGLNKIIDNFLKSNSANLPRTTSTNNKIAFIVGKPFPARDNTFCNAFYSFISYLSASNEIDIYLAFTNELTIDTPFGGIGKTTQRLKKLNIKWWEDAVGLNPNEVFFGGESINKNLMVNALTDWLITNDINKLVYLGGVYESRFVRHLLYNDFLTCVFPTTSNVKKILGKPDFFSDIYIYLSMSHYQSLLDCKIDKNSLFPYQNSLNYVFDDNDFDLQKYGIFGDKKNIITVIGNNHIKNFFETVPFCKIELMKKLLRRKNLRWILVGQSRNDILLDEAELSSLDDDFLFINYTKNLSSLYKSCDLFFQIPVNGGGGAIAIASQCDLVTLIPDYSDSAAIVKYKFNYIYFDDALEKIDYFFSCDINDIKINLLEYDQDKDALNYGKQFLKVFESVADRNC